LLGAQRGIWQPALSGCSVLAESRRYEPCPHLRREPATRSPPRSGSMKTARFTTDLTICSTRRSRKTSFELLARPGSTGWPDIQPSRNSRDSLFKTPDHEEFKRLPCRTWHMEKRPLRQLTRPDCVETSSARVLSRGTSYLLLQKPSSGDCGKGLVTGLVPSFTSLHF
jgi:hypothetical protein